MSKPHEFDRPTLRERLIHWLNGIWDNVYLWGLIGWLLIAMRYTSDVVLPQYGH